MGDKEQLKRLTREFDGWQVNALQPILACTSERKPEFRTRARIEAVGAYAAIREICAVLRCVFWGIAKRSP